MPYKITRAIGGNKQDAVVSTYVTALPVAVAVTHVAVYVDLTPEQMYRQVEIQNRVRECAQRAREDGYARPVATSMYWTTPIAGGKDAILANALTTNVVDGTVSVALGATVQSDDTSSLLVDLAVEEILEWFLETVLKSR